MRTFYGLASLQAKNMKCVLQVVNTTAKLVRNNSSRTERYVFPSWSLEYILHVGLDSIWNNKKIVDPLLKILGLIFVVTTAIQEIWSDNNAG